MGMSFAYGPQMEETEAGALLHQALDLGVDHFDTAEMYGFATTNGFLGQHSTTGATRRSSPPSSVR